MSLRSIYPRKQVLALHSSEMITKQSSKNECDIHNILKQYQKTGMIAHIASREPYYADLPNAMDYQEAIELVRTAQESFEDLPAKVRERFDNDPFNLLAALHDPANRAELEELGIVSPSAAPAAPVPAPAPVSAPAAPPPGDPAAPN